jgi:hypothetical protein
MREPSAVSCGRWGRCLGLAVVVAVLAAGVFQDANSGGQSTGSGGQAAAATTWRPWSSQPAAVRHQRSRRRTQQATPAAR